MTAQAETTVKLDAEIAAELREATRRFYAEQGIDPTKVDGQLQSTLRNLWAGADASTLEFAVGMQAIEKIENNEKAPGVLTIYSKFAGELSYMQTQDGEFIGLSAQQAASDPLTPKKAGTIAVLAAARGWKAITVQGSAEERDMLWLEAVKIGLEVKGHMPSPAYKKAFEDFRATLAAEEGTAPVTATVVPQSRFTAPRVLPAPRAQPLPALEGPKAS